MGLLRKSFKVVRIIWPYDEGHGVVMTQFGNPLTVLSSGQSKEDANKYLTECKQELK